MTGMPSDLAGLIGALQDRRGEVVKLAVTPHRYADALRILTFDRAPRKKIALMAMGPFSLCTRVLSESAGNFLTYCAAAADSPTAPGQPTLDEMLHLYRVPDLGRRPRVFGLLGTGISHSLSPRLHNGWFKRRREPCVYLPFDTKGIDDFLALSLSLPMAGWSVTAPFKLEMARRVDRLAPSARLAGSVNTVIAHGRKLIGYNTDIRALIHLLNETGGNPAFRIRRTTSGIVYRGRVLIIGAGGTAIAVCRALRQHGADVVMTARRLERRNVAQEIGVEFIPWNRRIQADAGVIINATPIGHAGWRGLPYPGSRLFSGHIIIDFPYGDGDTDFVRAGRKAGCRIIDGKRLLLEQARLQRKLFAQAKQAVRLS